MKRNVFAVCDLEVDYAVNFMEYMQRKKNIPFELQAFTSVESLEAFASVSHVELLLISERAMCPRVRELDIGRLVILSEGLHLPELDEYPSVYKYQSSANVVREVMACYGEQEGPAAPVTILKKNTRLLAVYSPLKRCLRTSFALTLGQVLAREKAVLYLNMEEYAGLEQLLQKKFSGSLGNLLYYARQRHPNMVHKLNAAVETIGQLDLVPPVRHPGDIRTAEYEDWEFLIRTIDRQTPYEVLILDVGAEVDETLELLRQCDRIYMPVLQDTMSVCKLRQFEELVREMDCPEVAEKIRKVMPPFHVSSEKGEIYIQQMVWGEMGDYVRKLVEEERRIKNGPA